MTSITFFVCDQMLATSLALPMEQLRAAENMALVAAKHRREHHRPLQFRMASLNGAAVTTQTGIRLQPDCALCDVGTSDITYLPALWRSPKVALTQNHALYPWLISQYQAGNIIAGVGTGCCFMAEAGLLDFRPATTHWYYFEQFARDYPKVMLKRDHFITRSDTLYCAASVNALADLTVFFIQRMFGQDIARHVERHFFHEVRKAYSPGAQTPGDVQAHADEEIAQLQSWIQRHAHENLEVSQLAKLAGMSLRSLNRRFKQAADTTPLAYIRNVRMRAAGELLQTSNLTVAEVAERVGYQDLSHFNGLFRRYFGTTPGQYRVTVRAKLFSAD